MHAGRNLCSGFFGEFLCLLPTAFYEFELEFVQRSVELQLQSTVVVILFIFAFLAVFQRLVFSVVIRFLIFTLFLFLHLCSLIFTLFLFLHLCSFVFALFLLLNHFVIPLIVRLHGFIFALLVVIAFVIRFITFLFQAGFVIPSLLTDGGFIVTSVFIPCFVRCHCPVAEFACTDWWRFFPQLSRALRAPLR